MRELQRGTHRPYPCGAGAGYLGVSADGDLAACHRFVGDDCQDHPAHVGFVRLFGGGSGMCAPASAGVAPAGNIACAIREVH